MAIPKLRFWRRCLVNLLNAKNKETETDPHKMNDFYASTCYPFCSSSGMVVLVSVVAVVVAILGDVVDWGPSVSDGPSLSLLK